MLVITGCTNRKRKPIREELHMSALSRAEIQVLSRAWAARLANEAVRFPAGDIYAGRAFREAALAAEHLGARLLVVSAGLGLVDAHTTAPPYACTVLPSAPDSVASRISGTFSAAGWWAALQQVTPFGLRPIDVVAETDGLICIALSNSYLEMVSADLIALSGTDRGRLRLFTRARPADVAEALRPFLMPYDDRLDGPDSPLRGTRGDFASRALHHFATSIYRPGDGRAADAHAAAVAAALDGWSLPRQTERERHDDLTLLDLIRAHWDAVGGSSTRLLRLFRDDLNIACEQSRFSALARQVREERT